MAILAARNRARVRVVAFIPDEIQLMNRNTPFISVQDTIHNLVLHESVLVFQRVDSAKDNLIN